MVLLSIYTDISLKILFAINKHVIAPNKHGRHGKLSEMYMGEYDF